MIIICCTDDPSLRQIAINSAASSANTFGQIYQIFKGQIPQLGLKENLFIIAHGAFADKSGNPVIGDKDMRRPFALNGIELWQNINGIFPAGYSGNVYIDACESADHDDQVFSFIEVFYTQVNLHFPRTMVYGRNGSPGGLISLPTSNAWRAAHQLAEGVTAGPSFTERSSPVQFDAPPPTPPASPKPVTLSPPGADPHNVQATKYYIFNETGNIMMSSTDLDSSKIQKSVRNVFAEVSVFFAAMTKAISTSKQPNGQPYQLYDYSVLEKVIDGSGLFVHVTEEDVVYTTESFGMEFSKQLIESLLGLATGAGELSFASAMISSMGSSALKISQQSSSQNSKVANIVFVCEYLLGMPVVSALVVYADLSTNSQSFSIGPCFSESSTSTTWTLHKDTYMFVTPKFIKKYAGDLLSVETDVNYTELVNYLKALISNKVAISGVVTNPDTSSPAPTALKASTKYYMVGLNFGTAPGTLKIGAIPMTVVATDWSDDLIAFTTPATAIATAAPLDLFRGTNTATPDGSTVVSYSVTTS
jgi:hypothetical protein